LTGSSFIFRNFESPYRQTGWKSFWAKARSSDGSTTSWYIIHVRTFRRYLPARRV